jgi:serine/threonine protein kinase
MVIKVADFGLAVNTGDKSYYRLTTNNNIKLPVMWMAPESLSTQTFSEKSDIVSVHANVCMIMQEQRK